MIGRRSPLLVIALIISACTGHSPTTPPPPPVPEGFIEFCKTAACRGHTVVELRKDDGTPFRLEMAMAPPIVQPGFVSIYPGESIFLEAERGDDGTLSEIRAIDEVTRPERSVSFQLSQNTEADGGNMVLVVHNGFPEALKYRLGMMLLRDPEPQPLRQTTVCPVLPGKSTYELWPHAIFQLVVTELRLVDENDRDAMACE